MAYHYNRPAAYLPDPARGCFVVPMHTLSLPAHWEEISCASTTAE